METKEQNLYLIAEQISFCQRCDLHKTRQNTCPGNRAMKDKTKPFKWMFVGEAPGQKEDEIGKVFVGKSGKLLQKVLSETGFSDFFITNTIKCRPPGNRDPKREEIRECAVYLVDQLDIVKPKVVICIGKIAKSIFDDEIFMSNPPYPVVTIYHPAHILRNMSKYDEWKTSLLRIKGDYDNE
jgi:DNA polymerase